MKAELATMLLGEQPLGLIARRVAELAVSTIPGAQEASVSLIERGRYLTVVFSGSLAAALDERQFKHGFGPSSAVAATGGTMVLDTGQKRGAFSAFARQARRQGIHHVLSVGLGTTTPAPRQISGALNVYGGAAAGFDEETRETAVSFASAVTPALLNAGLYASALEELAQMKEAMVARALIEQAKGVIMAQQHVSDQEAFAILAATASRSHHKVRDLARSIIDQAARG